MSRKKKSKALSTAKQYANLLLYEVSGGNLGQKPELDLKTNTATFGEKRGLLDSLIKIAALEQEDESDEAPSGFDAIKKDLAKRNKLNGGGEASGSGNSWGESSSYGSTESGTDSTG